MFKFGVEEKIRKMVKTELKDEKGREIWVGNKITIYEAFAGVYGREDGYVLTANTDEGYMPWPGPEELKGLQLTGMIPKDLPKAEMNGMDIFGSFMLWWIMVPLILWYIIVEKIKAIRKPRTVDAIDEQTRLAAEAAASKETV